MKVLFLTNPRSGSSRNRSGLPDRIFTACRGAGLDAEVRPCLRIEDLDSMITGAVEEGFAMIVAVGGDGTVSEIGKRLIGSPAALGVVPIGSGNGLARHLHLPLRLAAAIETIMAGRIETIDTAVVNQRPFLGVCGVGFDAEIAHRFHASTIRGIRTYVVEGVRSWLRFREENYTLTIDGETVETPAFVVAVANSGQYGNEARIAPRASLKDGLLDVTIVREPSVLRVPDLLHRLFRGTLAGARGVTLRQGREIVLRRSHDGPGHLDGEPVSLERELRFTIRPGSLRIVVPPDPRPF